MKEQTALANKLKIVKTVKFIASIATITTSLISLIFSDGMLLTKWNMLSVSVMISSLYTEMYLDPSEKNTSFTKTMTFLAALLCIFATCKTFIMSGM